MSEPDATTTTETPPPEGATETPPAETTETTEGTPSVEDFVNDESLDLESSGLPEPTQKEIRKLRGDSKKYRETATAWESATDGWDQESVDMLRTALAGAKTDPTAVAQWFIDNAKNLAGDRFDTILAEIASAGEDPPDPDEDPDGEAEALTPEKVAQMVKDAIEEDRKTRETTTAQQQRVQEIIDQTEALGFGPTHPMHTALLSEAKKLDGDDRLEKAAELLIEHGARPTTKNDNETSQDAPAEAGRTPAPPEGVTPAGSPQVRDPKAAMRERLDRELGARTGFADTLSP